MASSLDLTFRWISGNDVLDETLKACSDLYSNHYGIWSVDTSPRPGKRIRLSPNSLRPFFTAEDSWVALAYCQDSLIAYAGAIRGAIDGTKQITWITQLVVHADYRNRDVAKRLLGSLWGFSDQYAWGLATSNPYAVRALEKATRRRCDPTVIGAHAKEIYAFGQSHIFYIKGKKFTVDSNSSIIDTEFPVSHAELPTMLTRASEQTGWKLGSIREGEEWIAFTFGSQPQTIWTKEELVQLLSDADQIVRQAYGRMTLDHGHRWAQYQESEIKYIINALKLTPHSRVADFGCGNGRHLIGLGAQGYTGIGVDFAEGLIKRAQEQSTTQKLHSVAFMVGDVRTISLPDTIDSIICLYDVIGTFPEDADNDAIITNIAKHLRTGGRVLASAMNLELTAHRAKYIVKGDELPQQLAELRPSQTMQDTGNIFNPDLYLLDPATSVVYRKEQFDRGHQLPAELIVRDRRYTRDELIRKFAMVGIKMIDCYYVRLGHWNEPLEPTDQRAKEILFLGEKQ